MWDEPGSTCMRLAASAERQLRHPWLPGCRRVGTRALAHTPGALVQSDDGHALLSPQSAMKHPNTAIPPLISVITPAARRRTPDATPGLASEMTAGKMLGTDLPFSPQLSAVWAPRPKSLRGAAGCDFGGHSPSYTSTTLDAGGDGLRSRSLPP